MRGGAEVFGGEWVVRSAGLTHIRRSSTRARVLLYIRPPCPRREIAAMGPKDAFCEYPSPAKAFRTRPVCVCTSAPAFTLPPHRLPRLPRSNRHPAAAVIHNALSTEKLSTSLLAALCKTFSPSRLRTRIYNISFARRPLPRVSASLRGRGRAVVTPCPAPPSAGWGRAKAKADAPSCSAPYLPAYGRAPAACVPNHCVQRRKCTRQSPLLPVRSSRDSLSTAVPPSADGRSAVRSPRVSPPTAVLPPADGRSAERSSRGSLSTAAPQPADGRSAERRVGEGEGKGGRPLTQCSALARLWPSPLAQQPALARLPPRPRRLNGSPASAGGRENDRMAHRRTATPTHRTQRGNDTCTIRVP